jgi:hypothetical protein
MDLLDQIVYPVHRLLANPRIFWAIAGSFDGPDAEIIQDAFYDLIEHQSHAAEDMSEVSWGLDEVCFRMDDERDGVFQIIGDNGNAVELHPQGDGTPGGSTYSTIKNMEQLQVSSQIYTHLISAIAEARPDLSGDIALVDMPTEANMFLRDQTKDCFSGKFHLLSDPEKLFDFEIEIIDLARGELKAVVSEA